LLRVTSALHEETAAARDDVVVREEELEGDVVGTIDEDLTIGGIRYVRLVKGDAGTA
jgi:hypothetical protein